MGRNPRIEYDEGIYHVISRGNNREYIFKGSLDKQFFIDQLKEQKNPLGFKLFGYVFMDNHYHLLLQTTNKPLHTINLMVPVTKLSGPLLPRGPDNQSTAK